MCLAVVVAGLLLCSRILHNLLKRQGQFRSEGGDKMWPLHLCPEWLDFVCRLMFKVTVTPKHTARISNPKAQKQKEITFVLRIRHCWSAVFHAVDYVFQHSWQFLLIVMNQSWTVSQLWWLSEKGKVQEIHFPCTWLQKYAKMPFMQIDR